MPQSDHIEYIMKSIYEMGLLGDYRDLEPGGVFITRRGAFFPQRREEERRIRRMKMNLPVF